MSKSNKSEEPSFIYQALYKLVQIILILAVITLMPGLPPDVDFTAYKLNLQPYTKNNKLGNIEKLFVNEVKGPEDLAVYKNELYTTTHGGHVQKIVNGKLVPVVKFGKKCKGLYEEHICGRPLGLRFDSKGSLFVADAYYGLFKVNMSTGQVNNFVSINEPIEGLKTIFPNSLAVSELTGDIYWTESSTQHKLYDGVYTMLANGNGRLLKYNAKKHKNEVLLRNIHFANGLDLNKDESFLVVCETFRARLLRYNLKGPKTGQVEVFAELPGFPDNIFFDGKNFYVGVITVPDTMLRMLPEFPLVRKLVARLATLVEMTLINIETLFPNELLKKTIHWIGHFESIGIQSSSIIMVFNSNGKLVESFSAMDDKIGGFSSFITHGGYHYLGSPFNDYLARIKAT